MVIASRATATAGPAAPLSRRGAAGASNCARGGGFTLIELIVVFAILALLVSIAVPRYFAHIDRAKEVTLRQDLSVMRDAIDKFHADKGRYPDSLDEMVSQRYLRKIPVDPITERDTTWMVLPPPPNTEAEGQVFDVKSGAEGHAGDGTAYADW